MTTDPIGSNITKVLEEVRAATEFSSRPLESVRVLAVSKTKPAEAVRAAHNAGLTEFGENYLQEAVEKIEACKDLDLTWHFIGPIQSNKTRSIAEHFQWVQSVDRSKILKRLAEHRSDELPPLNVCIQVNISGEASKSGCEPEELDALLAEAADLPSLKLRGLMAIPAPAKTFEAQKKAADPLAALFEAARERYPSMDTLSIGMSSDLRAAIAAGSTMVRIGTAIFGARER